jgi:hypothetical protein
VKQKKKKRELATAEHVRPFFFQTFFFSKLIFQDELVCQDEAEAQ